MLPVFFGNLQQSQSREESRMSQTRFDQYQGALSTLLIPDYLASPERSLLAQQVDQQLLQTGVMVEMAGTLNSIGAEMAAARHANSESLAIQQEMLQREKFQEMVEELVYQTEKMVTAFAEPTCDVPPAQRYFGLKGVLDTVEQFEIQTAIIRGRENKAAFERTMDHARRQCSELEKVTDVRDAITFVECEQERLERLEREKEAKRQELAAKIAMLETAKKPTGFKAWYTSTFSFFFRSTRMIESSKGASILVVGPVAYAMAVFAIGVQLFMWVFYGFVWIRCSTSLCGLSEMPTTGLSMRRSPLCKPNSLSWRTTKL